MKLLVAIPAFNEETSIAQVIQDVQMQLPAAKTIVIDDGSTDKTSDVARAAGATVIGLPFNVGVGGALRVAFKYALDHKYDRVLQVDADGQHLPSEAKKLLDQASADSIVVGSRFLTNEKEYEVGFARKFAMIILAFIISKICATKLTDVTSGFRLTSGLAIKIFSTEYPRDYLGDTVESLIIARHFGIEIIEVPVLMQQRVHGNPSQNLAKSIWYLCRAMLVIALALVRKSENK